MLAGDRGHLTGLRGVQRERLLAQHVLARRGARRPSSRGGCCAGDATYTMSTSGSAYRSAYEPWAVGIGTASANSSAASWVRDPTATTSASSKVCSASVMAAAMLPVEAMPHLMSFGHRDHRDTPPVYGDQRRLPPTFTSNRESAMPSSTPSSTPSSNVASKSPRQDVRPGRRPAARLLQPRRPPRRRQRRHHRPSPAVRLGRRSSSTCARRHAVGQRVVDRPADRGSGRRCARGEPIVVIGTVQRRFFRVGGATQSRTEVVADQVIPARRVRSVRSAIAAAARSLGD